MEFLEVLRYKYQYILWIILVFSIVSCQKNAHNRDSLEYALEMAGENRIELEKVLFRYSQFPIDSLKYKAACFLMENMPYYSYYEGELLDNYLSYFKLLKENKNSGVEPSVISSTIIEKYGLYSLDSLNVRNDIQEIDSAYLCNNIEWAFKVWQEQPWGRNISFDDFCEYILPYRIEDEIPEYWREELYNKYNTLLHSLLDPTSRDIDDPVNAARLLIDKITKEEDVFFTTTAPASFPHVGATISQLKCGSCKELTDYIIYVCRALGIPCHIDFILVRGNDNAGHFWVSYTNKDGELYALDFPGNIRKVRLDGIRNDPKSKVYRQTFSLNKIMKNKMISMESFTPDFFINPRFIDVTFPYANAYIQNIKLSSSQLYIDKTNSSIGYLCVSQGFSWVPIAWGILNKDGITFEHLQKGDIWRVATWKNNALSFCSDPFRVHPNSNQITFYSSSDSTQNVVLYAKFGTDSETVFKKRMLGGVFEGSNDINFRHKDTLLLINQMPERLIIKQKINSPYKYKYVRYFGPQRSHCNISEVSFYENAKDTTALQGRIIGTPGSFDSNDPHEYTNVFDEKTWTSFDYKFESGGWSGLDLGIPRKIEQIAYTPRNRDNYIRPGDTFELFCCDRTWKSFGIVTSTSDSLLYSNVPHNTLLFLKCYSRGNQERIFTYEKGKQIWK